MPAELGDDGAAAIALIAVRQIQLPDLYSRVDAAFARRQVAAALRVGNSCDGFAGRVEEISLTQFLWVEEHDGASETKMNDWP